MKKLLLIAGLLTQTTFAQNFNAPLEMPVTNSTKIDYYCLKDKKTNFLTQDYTMLLKGDNKSKVIAVFDGEIEKLGTSGTNDQSVFLIRNGQYFALYEGIVESNFQIGQRVKAGEELGNVAKQGLIFQIWKGKDKLDLKQWLTLNCM